MSRSVAALNAWLDHAGGILRAIIIMMLAWVGNLGWSTYVAVQEANRQNAVLLLRFAKVDEIDRNLRTASEKIDLLTVGTAGLDGKIRVIEQRLGEHDRRFDTQREALVEIRRRVDAMNDDDPKPGQH